MGKKVPCYGCEKRWAENGDTCHSSCEEYKAYSQARADRARQIYQKKAEERMVTGVLVKAAEKTKERKRSR